MASRAQDARAPRYTRGSEKRDGGFTGRGVLQRWPVELPRSGHARRPSVRRANRGWLLSCRLSLRTPAPTPIAFFRAPYERLFAKEGLRRCVRAECPGHKTSAAARAGTAKPGASAPASPERSQARGGTLLTRVRVILGLRGGGGRVDVTKPNDAPSPPHHPKPVARCCISLGGSAISFL